MSPVRVLKTVGAPLVWLLRYVVRGMSIVGLGVYAAAIPTPDQNSDSNDSLPGPAELSHDERLWEDELAADDAGAA